MPRRRTKWEPPWSPNDFIRLVVVIGLMGLMVLLLTVREEVVVSALNTAGDQLDDPANGITTTELILIVLMAAMLGRFWKDKNDD